MPIITNNIQRLYYIIENNKSDVIKCLNKIMYDYDILSKNIL